MLARGPEAVSPTAHYTGAVWAHAGLSHPALATPEGRLLHGALRPAMAASRLLRGPTLEGFLLARHQILDHRLEAAIEEGRVAQVVEIAAGLSPRGWRFTQRHGRAIDYVEADLPGMAARKRRALARAGTGPRVVELDAFAEGGLDALAATLDPTRGVAVITEGLLNYFDRAAVEGLWRRVATLLAGFPSGVYLSDLHLRQDVSGPPARAFAALLGVFVRGRIHLHYDDAAQARSALTSAGFARVAVHRPVDFRQLPAAGDRSARLVRIIEAAR